jgi:hypothetical protein
MKSRGQWTVRRSWALGTAILVLALTSWVGFKDAPRILNFGSHSQDQRVRPSVHDAPAPVGINDRLEVRRYFMDFAGDHSLDVATVTEQASAGYARYTVQLHLASGAEQSIAMTAPPGGLQLEMHDMTGDKIQNDLILRPALSRWLPTVLVNDGHGHFAVAISGPDPDSLSSGQELAPRECGDQGIVALLSPGFRTSGSKNDGGVLLPQIAGELPPPATQTISQSLCYSSSSGRAPPTLVITA